MKILFYLFSFVLLLIFSLFVWLILLVVGSFPFSVKWLLFANCWLLLIADCAISSFKIERENVCIDVSIVLIISFFFVQFFSSAFILKSFDFDSMVDLDDSFSLSLGSSFTSTSAGLPLWIRSWSLRDFDLANHCYRLYI